MTENQLNKTLQATKNDTQIFDIVVHYLSYWKLFIASVVVIMTLTILYLRYSTTVYNVWSTIQISNDRQSQTGDINAMAFNDLGIPEMRNSFDNEIEVLMSRTLMKSVVDSLKLNITYIKKGRIKSQEIYSRTPILVSIPNIVQSGILTVSAAENGKYLITSDFVNFKSEIDLDSAVNTPFGVATFSRNPFMGESLPIDIHIGLGGGFSLRVAPVNETSNVVRISSTSSVPEKAQDIVNTLVTIYNRNAINEKNYIARNTSDFIKERLKALTEDLETSELDVEKYNKSRGIVDLSSQKQMLLSSSSEYDRKILDNEVQLNLLRTTKAFIIAPENNGKTVPTNIGLTDQTILSQLAKYNEVVQDKEINAKGMKPGHPTLIEYDNRIGELKNNVLTGISLSENTLLNIGKDLQRQENAFFGLSQNLTTQERESRELLRKQSIKESIYVYLCQKLEEVGISLAQATPNAKIIDPASSSYISVVFPNRGQIMMEAFLISLFLPIVFIFLKDLTDNKIHTKDDITKLVSAPFLGDIPMLKNPEPLPVLKIRSTAAERFRVVSSNLDFILTGSKSKVIQITSTTSNEGKSFFSRNLALSLATTGNKTILIDMDMRKSVMNKMLNIDTESGIALYLSNPDVDLNDIIDTSGTFHKNLDIIPIKVFPPNPAELLATGRTEALFNELSKRYDYIIIDTAPVGLVADAFILNKFA
ncbi:MAG: polysaccharide biosynthesis tyrosine autokinase, partial [Dysgonamonadaceae bacterium]|nr:polysaccharide biosynthesis tyrosine autokinase [Dysgonamonadaceae bacterium]